MSIAWRLAALRNGFQDAVAYRLEFFFEIFGSAFVPVAIQWVLWYALFKIGGAQTIAGMTYAQLVSYTMMSLLFSQVRGGDHDFELQEMIRSGQLSNYLLRPVGVVEFVYIRGVAPKILIAGFCLVMGCAVGMFYGLSPVRLTAAMGMAMMGNIIHYQIGAALSATAFVWEEAFSFLMVKNMLVSLLSGELLPLNLFPAKMQWLWKSTPFYLYVFGPIEYGLGHWTTVYFAKQLLIGCAWMVFGWGFIKITWRLGMRRYLSIGG